MGTYVWYSGMADYPLEKRKRIKENILKMLDAGGMMQIESVKNNNHELYVLSKPEKDQNNRILWNFKMICGKLQVWIAKTYRFILIK